MRRASAGTSGTGTRERVLILSAGVGAGHNSAAAALRQAGLARDDVDEVRVLDVLEESSPLYRDLLGKGYFALVDAAPWLVEWGYDLSDPPFRRRGPIDPWTRANAIPTIAEIRRFDPTIVICTHFLPAQLIASLLLRGTIDARTAIVTTDYDFQGLWLTSAFHTLFVAREEGRVQLTALGLPSDRIRVTGIPISRPDDAPPAGEHSDPAPTERRRAPGTPPALLVSAGAKGGDYALATVRQTLALQSPVTVTVVCGRNEELRRRIEELVAPARDRYRVLGFTKDMPRLLREADLFIGKPGGLSASECMAAGLPMVLINPIPGQEVRNGDYLMEQGAAIRCSTPFTIGWKIDQVLQEPGALERMQAAARRVGRPNAAAEVMAAVIEGPARPIVVTRAAQRSILAASGRRLQASELTGDAALVRLVEKDTDHTVALLRSGEVADLQKRASATRGELVLQRDDSRMRFPWEARRLVSAILRGDESLAVRVEPLTRVVATGERVTAAL